MPKSIISLEDSVPNPLGFSMTTRIDNLSKDPASRQSTTCLAGSPEVPRSLSGRILRGRCHSDSKRNRFISHQTSSGSGAGLKAAKDRQELDFSKQKIKAQ
jgi:hypothetical protein